MLLFFPSTVMSTNLNSIHTWHVFTTCTSSAYSIYKYSTSLCFCVKHEDECLIQATNAILSFRPSPALKNPTNLSPLYNKHNVKQRPAKPQTQTAEGRPTQGIKNQPDLVALIRTHPLNLLLHQVLYAQQVPPSQQKKLNKNI